MYVHEGKEFPFSHTKNLVGFDKWKIISESFTPECAIQRKNERNFHSICYWNRNRKNINIDWNLLGYLTSKTAHTRKIINLFLIASIPATTTMAFTSH